MTRGRVVAAGVAAWIASIPIGYLVNEVLFANLYAANAAAFRPHADILANLPIGIGFQLIGFIAFAFAFTKGYEGKSPVGEGIRFGILITLMIDCFAIVWNYVTTPISVSLMIAMMIDYLVEGAIYGAIVGAVSRPAGKPAMQAAKA